MYRLPADPFFATIHEARAAAERAAGAAGELLRREAQNPAGVRRSSKGAAVDSEMDVVIRRMLLEAFPDFGYFSEELPPVEGRNKDFWWVVDPHDGTSRFLEGDRGSAVSIALVHKGEPVAGVVYAPLAPDHGGDMITWGLGRPVMRNGRFVTRAPWPAQLDGDCIIALAPRADRQPAATLRAVAPARYRTAACPAYRLALAAVGEVDGAALLTGLDAWDVAGGHALVRGAGGVLVDAAGKPVRYRWGVREVGRCYAGAPAVAEALRVAMWPTYASRDADASPKPAYLGHVLDPQLLIRAQGCLLGLFVGDALGQMVEFSSAREIAQSYPDGVVRMADGGFWGLSKGQPTDDGELALSLAAALAEHESHDLEAVWQGMLTWGKSRPFDVGTTTRQALSGERSATSQSNGALMRVAPLAVRMVDQPIRAVIEAARLDAMLTHVSPVVHDANAAYVVGLVIAMRGTNEPYHHRFGKEVLEQVVEVAERFAFHPDVQKVLREALEASPLPALDGPDSGWCLLALRNAFQQAAYRGDFTDSLLDTVSRGGDTDTTGAIAGALLGAIHGRDAIPLEWRRAVLSARAAEGTLRPRPSRYWPVHAMELAETLLLRGAIEGSSTPSPKVVKQGQLGPGLTGTVTWHPDATSATAWMADHAYREGHDAETLADHLADAFIRDQLITPAVGVSILAGEVMQAMVAWLEQHDMLEQFLAHSRRSEDPVMSTHPALYRRLHRHGGYFGRVDDEPYWHGVRFKDPARMTELIAREAARTPETFPWAYLLGGRRALRGVPAFSPISMSDWPDEARQPAGTRR